MAKKGSDTYKYVVVGDDTCGKTSLISTYSNGQFPTGYIPTVLDMFSATTVVGDDKEIKFNLWDSAGNEEYTNLRTLSYPLTSVFILCFNVADRKTFDATKRWVRELRDFDKKHKYCWQEHAVT